MLQCSFQSGGWVTLTPLNVCQDFCDVCLVLCLPACLPATVSRSCQVGRCRVLNRIPYQIVLQFSRWMFVAASRLPGSTTGQRFCVCTCRCKRSPSALHMLLLHSYWARFQFQFAFVLSFLHSIDQ